MDSNDCYNSDTNYSTLLTINDNVKRNATNTNDPKIANLLKSSETFNETVVPKEEMMDGLILPFWPHYDCMSNIIIHGMVYFVGVCYAFVGVAIISERFMTSIEKITSRQKEMIVRKSNGEEETISVRVWNETVANLTLMVLGSSAPDILLSVIEVYAKNFNAGELGPSTVVGSTAFNMFTIIAICVWCVPTSEAKKIKQLRVFCVTLVCSIFAYIWMLFILIWSSYGVIEIWEGLLTLIFFPLTVLFAYIADRRLLIFKYLSKDNRINKEVIYGEPQSDGENVELTAVLESNDIIVKDNGLKVKSTLEFMDASDKLIDAIEKQRQEAIVMLRAIRNKNPELSIDELESVAREELQRLRPKSRAYYRVLNAQRFMGYLSDKSSAKLKNSIKHYEDDYEQLKLLNMAKIKVFFDPQYYTAMEDCGNFNLNVTRTCNSEPTIIVDYETRDGTAKSGDDYKASKGEITFGRGETRKQITIEIIDDEQYEEDEQFFVILSNARYLAPKLGNNREEDSSSDVEISEAIANIIVPHNDHSGVFSFHNNDYQIQESINEFCIKVSRIIGACGRVSLPYRTVAGTAKEYEDYMPAVGNLLFENNETNKQITIQIVNSQSYEKCAHFYVELGHPKRVDSDHIDNGSPRLGDVTKCMVRIRECKQFKHTVIKLIKESHTVSAMTTCSWKQQFIESITVRAVNDKSILSYISHYATLFWKVISALIPPPIYLSGWACFSVSIIVIGIITALINDLASHFGATIGLKDSVTAITFVALGTSVPDTFASKIAAQKEKYADSAIGNVTGSNAVNVFLGIGIAWTIAAIYHYLKQTAGGFTVDPGSLSFSVSLYCVFAFVCSAVLMMRRRVLGGELGGHIKYKLTTTVLFVGLWVTYVVVSILEAYKIIAGF